MKPISVIVPSYNHAEYVEACLDSIYFQDYPSIELVIVDDNSSDDSEKVILNWIRNIKTEDTSFASRYNEQTGEIQRTVHPRYNKIGRTVVFEGSDRNIGSTAR